MEEYLKKAEMKRNNYVYCYVTAGFFLLISSMSVLKYYSLHAYFYDLGVFLWHFYKIGTLHEFWVAFSGHNSPVTLLSSLLSVFPFKFIPFILLIGQAFFLCAPGYWILKYYGWTIFCLYILYFPIWYLALFDFHPDFLAVPVLFIFFYYCYLKKYWNATFVSLFLALIKEPFSLQTIFCGLFIIIQIITEYYSTTEITRKRFSSLIYNIVPGLISIVIGISYFYISVAFIIPYFNPDLSNSNLMSAYSWMGTGILNKSLFLFTHPVDLMNEIILNRKKIIFIIAVFGSCSFLPLLSPRFLIPAIPPLAIALLSRSENVYALGHHYLAGVVAPVCVASIHSIVYLNGRATLEPIKKYLHTTVILIAVISNMMLSPSPISRLFWYKNVPNYSYKAYIPTTRDAKIKEAIDKYIPQDNEVSVSFMNSLCYTSLVKRKSVYSYPRGVTIPFPEAVKYSGSLSNFISNLIDNKLLPGLYKENIADYVVLDLKRPWFMVDYGCIWENNMCVDNKFVNDFISNLNKTKILYKKIYDQDEFLIFALDNKTPKKN